MLGRCVKLYAIRLSCAAFIVLAVLFMAWYKVVVQHSLVVYVNNSLHLARTYVYLIGCFGV